MLKSIRMVNFFSFADTTVELEPDYNVLIGINGSGKSNVFKAIRLLKEGVAGIGLKKLINDEWGGVDNVMNLGKGGFNFSIEYLFTGMGGKENEELIYKLDVVKPNIQFADFFCNETLGVKNNDSDRDIPLMDVDKEGMKVYNEAEGQLSQITFKSDHDVLSLKVASAITNLNGFRDVFSRLYTFISGIVIYDRFDTSPDGKIRRPALATAEQRIQPGGGNVLQTLNGINANHKEWFKKIIEYLKAVNVHFTGLDFFFVGGRIELRLEENGLSRAVPVTHISDGTLRYLCLLAILLNPDRGSLICIDEPETGLHPDMMYNIAKLIKLASKETQFIVSTHSEVLLENFKIENVLIIEKDEHNASVFRKYTEEQIAPDGEEFSLSALWRNGRIGGNRW